MLLARRKDLVSLLADTKKRKDGEGTTKLSAALEEIDEALHRLVLPKRGLVVAASLEGEEEEEEEAEDDVDDVDDLDDEEVEGDDENTGEGDPAVEVEEAEPTEPEPTEPENPVAMNSRLRKEMGDSSADFLDDYGHAIHKKVIHFFESLMTKALDLGTEDDTDGENSLMEVLRDEVGKRGIRRIEPVFEEWRGAVIKQIAKDIAEMFKPPEPEPEISEAPEGTESATPAEESQMAPSTTAGLPAVASADNTPLQVRAVGRVSFAVKASASPVVSAKATDFKPSGFTTPRLD